MGKSALLRHAASQYTVMNACCGGGGDDQGSGGPGRQLRIVRCSVGSRVAQVVLAAQAMSLCVEGSKTASPPPAPHWYKRETRRRRGARAARSRASSSTLCVALGIARPALLRSQIYHIWVVMLVQVDASLPSEKRTTC